MRKRLVGEFYGGKVELEEEYGNQYVTVTLGDPSQALVVRLDLYKVNVRELATLIGRAMDALSGVEGTTRLDTDQVDAIERKFKDVDRRLTMLEYAAVHLPGWSIPNDRHKGEDE